MKCPECGFKIEALPCRRCEEETLRHEQEYERLAKEFSLERGAPVTKSASESLSFALSCIQARVKKERFNMTVSYKAEDLLHHANWWYVPYRWIGCNGFIVNKQDGYVNWLGSALTLRQCFWGHERSVFTDMVDFKFSPQTDKAIVTSLLGHFKHLPTDSNEPTSSEPIWYQGKEIEPALLNQFPLFKNHFVWFCIPYLMEASEKHGLHFTCSLAK